MGRVHTDLKNRHPNRIDIRVLRGELVHKPAGELELLGVQ